MHELVYTSAPKGLKPGSQGFCTVACSAGLPPNLMMRLESLSGYRPLVPPGQSTTGGNPVSVHPVVRSHLILRVGGTDWHVLSRIADAGVDYTQRANKIAHHIVFEPSELPPDGPAALLACESRFFRSWDGEPKWMMKPAPFPPIHAQPPNCGSRCSLYCKYWEQVTGDAGWGGVLAETARDSNFDHRQQVILIVTPETDTIALFAESLALLPPKMRWQTTFATCCPAPVLGAGQTTHHTRFMSGIHCRWRCVLAGSAEMAQVGLSSDAMLLDLTQPLKSVLRPNNVPVPGPLVKAARSGNTPWIHAGILAGLSAALDAERQHDNHDPVASESHGDEPEETVPIAKRPKTSKKTRFRDSGKSIENNPEARSQKPKAFGPNWGLIVLLGWGLLFFGVPAWLIVMMVFAKGCQSKNTEVRSEKLE